jgi:hypothetical protein
MHLQTTLLRKELTTLCTLILRKVRISMIDNQTLLLNRDSLAAVGHPAAPVTLMNRVKKV